MTNLKMSDTICIAAMHLKCMAAVCIKNVLPNGKPVGGVTHVLVNDPTRGYGIFIENMPDAAG